MLLFKTLILDNPDEPVFLKSQAINCPVFDDPFISAVPATFKSPFIWTLLPETLNGFKSPPDVYILKSSAFTLNTLVVALPIN